MTVDILFQTIWIGDVVIHTNSTDTVLYPAVVTSITDKMIVGKVLGYWGYFRCPLSKAHQRLLKLTQEQVKFLPDSFLKDIREKPEFSELKRQLYGPDK